MQDPAFDLYVELVEKLLKLLVLDTFTSGNSYRFDYSEFLGISIGGITGALNRLRMMSETESNVKVLSIVLNICNEALDIKTNIVDGFVDYISNKNIKPVHGYLDIMTKLTKFMSNKDSQILDCLRLTCTILDSGDLPHDTDVNDIINTVITGDLNAIKALHDSLINICNEAERRSIEERDKLIAEKWAKQYENFSKLEFSDPNFEYQIVAPKTPGELDDEGRELHHCVASYKNDVANGNTIIVFLRKSNELNTPWYTIEVYRDKIRQAHSYCNSDISEDENHTQIINFLKLWAKNKKLDVKSVVCEYGRLAAHHY